MRSWGTEIHSRDAGSGIQGKTCSERVGDGVWGIRSPVLSGSTELWASAGKKCGEVDEEMRFAGESGT